MIRSGFRDSRVNILNAIYNRFGNGWVLIVVDKFDLFFFSSTNIGDSLQVSQVRVAGKLEERRLGKGRGGGVGGRRIDRKACLHC